jgi:hypothetical protein
MRFNRIDFKREGFWLLVIAVGLPAIGLFLTIIVPRLFAR